MFRNLLMGFFILVLLAMLAITTYASLDRSILNAGSQLTSDPWFRATLADAYFGFLTFYVWVAYKEVGLFKKLVWFVVIMTLGNIAIASYLLWQLWGLDQYATPADLLLRSDAPTLAGPGGT
jgi:hypothetical protein